MVRELIKTAVVTGGHSFDVIGFNNLFRNLPSVQAYIQHIDDFSAAPEIVRDWYDVVVFYIFLQKEPEDENQPSWAGKPRTMINHLGESGQGLVIMHHALLAYRGWSVWNEIVGVEDRGIGFHHGQQLNVEVRDKAHQITQDLTDWEMIDETYTMADAGSDSHILLTTDHPKSMQTLAWTRKYKNARVFCLESGHDNQTFVNPNFKQVLAQGIRWAAGSQ